MFCFSLLFFFLGIGTHEGVGPIVVSIATKPDGGNYRAIIWTKSGEERLFLAVEEKHSAPSSKHLLKRLKETQRSITDVQFRNVTEIAFRKRLAEMELCQVITSYKFGVLLAKSGQITEEAMFSNKESTPAFEEFLSFLGDRVSLLGWKDYRAGLDTVHNRTGIESVYTKLRSYEIMFHVSTLLPFYDHDRQQLERKRHIGNDIVVIVFQEDPQTSYSPVTISSMFNHVFVIVNPMPPTASDRARRYRITIAAKEGVRPWKPLMPTPNIFEKSSALREFLLTKLINAERAAYHAPAFSEKIARTRRTLLANLIKDYSK